MKRTSKRAQTNVFGSAFIINLVVLVFLALFCSIESNCCKCATNFGYNWFDIHDLIHIHKSTANFFGQLIILDWELFSVSLSIALQDAYKGYKRIRS